MDLYAIVRRNGWASPDDLQAAAARSTAEGDKSGSGVRWIRSYVLAEESGELGTVCIYEAESSTNLPAEGIELAAALCDGSRRGRGRGVGRPFRSG